MAMKHVRSGEVDTPDEVARALNRIIDNVNQVEAKVVQLAIPKPEKKKKGAIMIKTIVALILVIVLLFGSLAVADITVTDFREQTVRPERDLAILLRKAFGQHNADIANMGQQFGTGEVFYVDSNVTTAGVGTTAASAVATLNEGVDLCTANRGDVVYVMQGHAETLSGSTDAIDLDIAGITVIGLGNGDDAPEFLFDTNTDEFVIGAANITIFNLRFRAGVTAITMGISIEDAGDFFTMAHCVFPKPSTNSFEFNDAIDVASGVTYLTIIGCNYQNDDAGAAPNHFIDLGNAALVGIHIEDNIIFGDFAVSAIWSNDTDTEVFIVGNTITNMTSGEHCIEFTTGSATGTCAYNNLFTDAEGTTLDPGSLKCFGNLVTTDVDLGGMPIPVLDDGTTVLNATTVTAIAAAVDALAGIGMIGLCDTNVSTTTVDSAALGGFGNDAFLEGWSLICIFDTGGTVGTAPSGEIRDITDYVSTGGTFTTAAWTAALTAGDFVLLTPTHLVPANGFTYGKTIYCDDGGSNGEGTSWQTAKTTFIAAEAIAAAGDTILIGENHNENWTQAAQPTLDVAGVAVIGMGEGDSRPRFDFDGNTTLVFTIDAAGCTLKNLRFMPGATDIAVGIRVEDAALGTTIENCAFLEGEASGTDEFTDAISVDTLATDLTVRNCTHANSGANGTFVNLDEATIADATIEGCSVFAPFSEAAIWWDSAVPTNLLIKDNVISNGTAGQLCIEGTGAATGVCSGNKLYNATFGSTLDPGSMSCFENYESNAINTSGHLVPAIDDEIADVGPGRIFYVDSGTPGAGDGRSWGTAVATLDAGVNLCSDDRGDTIYVAAGHTEAVTTAYADLDLGGITVIGLGNGKLRPFFDYTGASGKMTINNDDITVTNLWFHANVDSVLLCIEVETGSENVTIEDCVFTTESATDEFDVSIDHAAGNHRAIVRNCNFQMGAANAVSAIHFIDSDYAIIEDNITAGDYSTACIHNETTASDHIIIRANELFNGTIGGGENSEPGIELKGDTSGMIVNNNIVCILTAPHLAIVADDCYLFGNKYNGLESSNGTRDIGLEVGKTYATSWPETLFVSDDAWIVAGGPILITSMVGQITTAYDGALTHTWWCDAGTAAHDIEWTDSVDIDAYLIGERIIFSNANPALIANLTAGATNGGGSSLMSPWFCPPGTIETLIEGPGASAGAISWYMTYIPLVDGITVTPQ